MLVIGIILLIIIVAIIWVNWGTPTSAVAKKKVNSLIDVFPYIKENEVLVIGLKNFMVEEVDIFPLEEGDEKSLEKMNFKMVKVVSSKGELVRMLNYQGFSHKKIRRKLLAYLEKNGEPALVDELKKRIVV